MTVLLLGGGGILGSGFREVLDEREVVRVQPRWGEPTAAASALRSLLPASLATGPGTLVWAAGAGSISASATAMAAETDDLHAVVSVVRTLPAEQQQRLSVLFASSAGALFAGHGASQVDEHTAPSPRTPYGFEKLKQEQALRRVAEETGCRVLLARYTNLYGLAAGRLSARGLVSTAVRATRLRQPMTVFVSPDTRRDLVFQRDAALIALRLVEQAGTGCTTTIVRDGVTRTVSEILAVVGSVCGRRVPAVFAERPETRLQPVVLRFRPPVQGPGEVPRTSFEAAVHRMVRAPLAVAAR